MPVFQGVSYTNAYGTPFAKLTQVPAMVWDGSILFSTIYKNSNGASLPNGVEISLSGTGHTIDNKGSIYTNMNRFSFKSLDVNRTIDIAQGATLDQIPELTNNVTLQSSSTLPICVNPSSFIYIGYACTLTCNPSVSGAKFISGTGSNIINSIFNSGTISSGRVFDLQSTSTLTLIALNVSQINEPSIYGTSGTNLNINYSSDSPCPSPTDLTNFIGTVNYLTLSLASQVQGAPLQLANLAALQSFPFTSQLAVGQWGYAQDTGIMYTYNVIDYTPPFSHTLIEFTGSGAGNLSGTLTSGYIPVANGANTLSDTTIQPIDVALNQTIGQIYKNGASFFLDNTLIIDVGTQNLNPLYTLTTYPTGTTQFNGSILVDNTTDVLARAFEFNNIFNVSLINAGDWINKIWVDVSAATATTILKNIIFQVSGDGINDIVTITGTGTTRTFNITSSSIVINSSDASSNPTLSGYLKTSSGLYQITAQSSASAGSIKVPSTYTNQSGTLFWKYTNLFPVQTANITKTTLKEITSFSFPQPAYSLNQYDTIACLLFGSTTSATPITINYCTNGNVNYSHFEMPSVRQSKSVFTPAPCLGAAADQYLTFVGKNLSSGIAYNVTFEIPQDADYIKDILLELTTASNIFPITLDLTSNYSIPPSLLLTSGSQSSLGGTYNIFSDTKNSISIKSLFPSAKAGSMCGIDMLSHTVAGYYCLGVTILYH
jgi:hypothetical protein